MLTCPDNELVQRLLAHDVEAFDALYARYSKPLYANIFKLIRDTEVAQDILQDVFVILWEKRSTIDAGQPISNWLFAVSYYNSLKYLRKSLREQLFIKDAESDGFVYQEPAGEHEETNIATIRRAIRQLSPQKQKVFMHCKVAGKSYRQVAEELSISRHTVKEYLSLAITSLRAMLK